MKSDWREALSSLQYRVLMNGRQKNWCSCFICISHSEGGDITAGGYNVSYQGLVFSNNINDVKPRIVLVGNRIVYWWLKGWSSISFPYIDVILYNLPSELRYYKKNIFHSTVHLEMFLSHVNQHEWGEHFRFPWLQTSRKSIFHFHP